MYYINIYTRQDVKDFSEWILPLGPPFTMCINGGNVLNISSETAKLFWLAGFQALINHT